MSREFVVVGDEAYLPDEWERVERRRALDRARYHADPARRAAVLERARQWNEAHPDQYRARKAESARRCRRDPEWRKPQRVAA